MRLKAGQMGHVRQGWPIGAGAAWAGSSDKSPQIGRGVPGGPSNWARGAGSGTSGPVPGPLPDVPHLIALARARNERDLSCTRRGPWDKQTLAALPNVPAQTARAERVRPDGAQAVLAEYAGPDGAQAVLAEYAGPDGAQAVLAEYAGPDGAQAVLAEYAGPHGAQAVLAEYAGPHGAQAVLAKYAGPGGAQAEYAGPDGAQAARAELAGAGCSCPGLGPSRAVKLGEGRGGPSCSARATKLGPGTFGTGGVTGQGRRWPACSAPGRFVEGGQIGRERPGPAGSWSAAGAGIELRSWPAAA